MVTAVLQVSTLSITNDYRSSKYNIVIPKRQMCFGHLDTRVCDNLCTKIRTSPWSQSFKQFKKLKNSNKILTAKGIPNSYVQGS